MISPDLLAVGSAAFGAIAALLAKRLLGDIPSSRLVGPNFLIIFALMVPFALIGFRFQPSTRSIALMAGIILIDIGANWALFESIRRADLAEVIPALGLVPVFAIAVAVVVFPADADPWRILLALVVVAATLSLQIIDARRLRWASNQRGISHYLPIVIALASSAAFGVSANLSKLLLEPPAPTNPYTLYFIRAAGIGIAMTLVARGFRAVRGYVAKIGARATFVILQWLCFLTAIGRSDVISVTTLANLTPVLAGIGSAVILGEEWTWRRSAAVAVAFLGSAALLAR